MTKQLDDQLLAFARLLRAAGMKIGSGQIADALSALTLIEMEKKRDFYWVLHSIFVSDKTDHPLFDEAFHLFWHVIRIEEQLLEHFLPPSRLDNIKNRQISPRLANALALSQREEKQQDMTLPILLSPSEQEGLPYKDFEKMSAPEIKEAEKIIAAHMPHIGAYPTRRWRRSARPSILDQRASLRLTLRDPESLRLRFKKRKSEPPPLIVLCDISGSMIHYSRLVLHFVYQMARREKVHAFLFGTRLSNVTRLLKKRDVDDALAEIGAKVNDWAGGTRIGASLADFNRLWSRRMPSHKAVILLITDGLERDDPALLAREAARMRLSCRRFLWLNPLLRYDGYEPKAIGAAILADQVDEMKPIHNLHSFDQLLQALEKEKGNERRYFSHRPAMAA